MISVLDTNMDDLKQMGVTCVKFFLEFNHAPAAADAEDPDLALFRHLSLT